MALGLPNFCRDYLVIVTVSSILNNLAGGSLLTEKCKSHDLPDSPANMCFCQGVANATTCNNTYPCQKNQIVSIRDFSLYPPESQDSTCDEFGRLSHKSVFSARCLQEKSEDEEFKKFLLTLMEAVSGKTSEHLPKNLNLVMADVLSKFPDLLYGTFIELQPICLAKLVEEVSQKMSNIDVCNKLHHHGINNAQIAFNISTNTSYSNEPTCFCKITSSGQSFKIRAADVRLKNDVSFKLQESEEQGKNSIELELAWWQDGILLESTGAIIELSNLSPEYPPDSFWLDIKGQNLNISCGSRKTNIIQEPQTESAGLSDMAKVGIGIGVCAVVVVIILVVCGIRRISRLSKEMADDLSMTSLEGDVHSPRREKHDRQIFQHQQSSESQSKVPAKDESQEGLLESQDESKYFDLEHQYEETPGSNNNVKAEVHYAVGGQIYEDQQPASPDDSDCNVYNHLRERPDVVPTGNIYDTAGSSDYARLQRTKAPPAIIDNTYSSLQPN